jgi:hypothetical protein
VGFAQQFIINKLTQTDAEEPPPALAGNKSPKKGSGTAKAT